MAWFAARFSQTADSIIPISTTKQSLETFALEIRIQKNRGWPRSERLSSQDLNGCPFAGGGQSGPTYGAPAQKHHANINQVWIGIAIPSFCITSSKEVIQTKRLQDALHDYAKPQETKKATRQEWPCFNSKLFAFCSSCDDDELEVPSQRFLELPCLLAQERRKP